jgi:hypothetical protein
MSCLSCGQNTIAYDQCDECIPPKPIYCSDCAPRFIYVSTGLDYSLCKEHLKILWDIPNDPVNKLALLKEEYNELKCKLHDWNLLSF